MEKAQHIDEETLLTQNEESTVDEEYRSYAMEIPDVYIMVQAGLAY